MGPFKDWDNDKLVLEAKSLYDSIYNFECYGAKDILRLETMLVELNRRGYLFEEKRELVVEKEEQWI